MSEGSARPTPAGSKKPATPVSGGGLGGSVVAPPTVTGLRRARGTLAAGAALVALGIVVAGTVSRAWGGALLVTGWLVLVAGIHAFGRTGPDAPSGD